VTSVLGGVLRRDAMATVVLLRGELELSQWPLSRAERADLAAVEVLARMALAARRLGFAIRLQDADPDLVELLGLAGLAEVAGLPGQVVGEAEDGEELGPEEVVVPDDPVA
jgi:ABC-type transporter Mla MlaB component